MTVDLERLLRAPAHRDGALAHDSVIAWVEQARERGEVGSDVDGETLLDLANGAAYYRLLWRGETIAEDEVEPLVDLILAGADRRQTAGG